MTASASHSHSGLAVTDALTVWLLPAVDADTDANADDVYELLRVTDAELLAEPVTLPVALLDNVSLALTDTLAVPDCLLDGVSLSVTLTLALIVTLTVAASVPDHASECNAYDYYELLTDADLLAEPVTLPDALLVKVSPELRVTDTLAAPDRVLDGVTLTLSVTHTALLVYVCFECKTQGMDFQ